MHNAYMIQYVANTDKDLHIHTKLWTHSNVQLKDKSTRLAQGRPYSQLNIQVLTTAKSH